MKHNNEFDRDIMIEPNNIPGSLLVPYEQSSRKERILTKILEDLDYPIEVMLTSDGKRTVESIKNCLSLFRIASNET